MSNTEKGRRMYFNSIKEYTKYLVDRKKDSEKIRNAYDLLEESDDNIEQVIKDHTLSPQEYIEVIALRRKDGYSLSAGGGSISAEHQTDLMYMNNPWKFIEEFLQNADDCKYKGTPSIDISVDEKKSTIEFVYNEEGFTRSDIWALTAFEQSTKSDENDGLLETEEEGVFYKEKTGRKGIGFKSVFSLKASNIRIHIRSNEYSFILDKAIGSVMPIWEDYHSNDGNTHVIVELIEPEHSPNEIYTEFKDAFCVETTSRLFEKNPVLFMHRLKDITVNWIPVNGTKECFSIVMDYDHLKDQYEEPFEPEKPILAGIRHKGQYYKKQFSFLEIQLITDDQIVAIPCVRETQMVDLYAKYRNISIIAPILTSNMDFHCDNGALFRTFPLEDNTFNIPFALDAPFELNTARKAIEYNDAKGARQFNNKIISLLFDGNGFLIDFMLFLRNLKDIQVDQYFRNHKVTLFENDANKDGKKRLIPIVDLTMVMRNIPVFRSYDNKEYLPLTRVFTVDPEVYSWLDATLFLARINERTGKTLVSEIYSKNSVVSCQTIIDGDFTTNLNDYLDSIERKYGIDNVEYLNFIEQKLYPYLQKNESELLDINAYTSLKVFISNINTLNGVIQQRETCKDSLWFTFTSKNNLSFWKYRIVESSPVVLNPLISVLKSQAKLKKLDEEFSGDITKVANSRCLDWDDIKGFIQAAYYYGFDLGKFTIDALGKYAVSKELDTHKSNYLRDAGVLEIIPDEDIFDFGDTFKNSSEVVDYLYQIGLRDWKKIGKLDKEVKSNYRLYPDSLRMIQSQKVAIVKQYLELIIKSCKSNGKKIYFSYADFDKCHDEIKLELMRNNQFIATDYYNEICKEILNGIKYWKTDSNEYGEMIIRARMREKINNLNNKRTLTFTLQYVIENKLESLVQDVLNKRKFNLFRITNNGFFEEVALGDIQNITAVLAPDKLVSLAEKKNVHFFKGNLDLLPEKDRYLIDGSGEVVYLHADDYGNYNDSLARYLKTSFDPIAVRFFAELEAQNQHVYDTYIRPVFETYGYDLNDAFDRIVMDYPSLSEEEYIRILSWFRKQSYAEELGNASKNSESEIGDDYKDTPWRFVYEFIQNVDDCSFDAQDLPYLEILIDETAGSISFSYNELGFTRDDIDALTKFANSNKEDVLDSTIPEEGLFNLEKTGRKGRGFKSVFSLPGDDVAVSIESNGYSFKIYKRVGQIIPFWFSSKNMPEKGSRITIEGFNKGKISFIYQKLKEIFGIKNINHFFSDCPLLYLRHLKQILVTDGSDSFMINIEGLYSKAIYSEEEFCIGEAKVVSGIRHQNHYCIYEVLPQKIKIKENDEIRVNIDAVRYSYMFNPGYKTRTVSLTAPIIIPERKGEFDKGGLYSTLPLAGNTLGIPFAINATFKTDSGRRKVEDIYNILHQETINVLVTKVLPAFYGYIRGIDGICIDEYIARKGDSLFAEYHSIQQINLQDLTWSYPVFKLEDSSNYIPLKEARMLPRICYSWVNPVDLAESFQPKARKVLLDHRYIDCKIYIPRIQLINIDFVTNLNQYIETISQNNGEALSAVMHDCILPFITNTYEDIRKAYRSENKVEELKKLRIFVFKMANGEYVIESADEQKIWLKGCPEQYQSYGNYRVMNNSPVKYTEEQLRWIGELHPIKDYNNAFSRNEFAAKNINTWEETKTLIETILYYNVPNSIIIPFLGRCVLDEKYDPEDNIFREAYKETQNINISAHYIDEQDILNIWADVGDVWQGEPEDIVAFIIMSGLRRGDDFFKVNRKTVNCDEETLAVFQEYCLTRERAVQVLNLVKKAWDKRVESKNSFDNLILEYESVKDCSPAFLTSLFNSDLMERSDMNRLAREYYNTDYVYPDNADYTETLLYAARLLDSKNVSRNRNLSISLSEIIQRKMGKCIQDVMLKLESKIEFYITTEEMMQPYPNEQINKALQWLSDSDRREQLSKDYQYYMTEIKEAFPQKTSESSMYLIDSEKVILNASSQREKDGLNSFVSKHYGGNDREFSALLSIIREQERLKNWDGTKKRYIDSLRNFRMKTDGLKKVLYPGMIENINNANSASLEYIIPELLQNINDCKNADDTTGRLLQIEIDLPKGIMKLVYDEAGFDYKNVYSITAMGQSSKHDSSEGEKGLGFKKVFTLFDYVEIYSNDFFFKLSREQDTVPRWIDEQEKIDQNRYENGTTMVFSTGRQNDLNRLAKQWESLFKDPYTDGQVSPLFLEKISEYKLTINGNRTFTITRDQIINRYHFIKKPLLKTYTDLLLREENRETVDNILLMIKESLRKRLKCKAMSDIEFEDYINNINITICFPEKMEKKVEGVFYSTLPTKTVTNSALFINLPLELTTGRDAVLKGSTSKYNECIFDMVFRCGTQSKSVYGIMLEEAAENMPDKEVFEYIGPTIIDWISNLSNGNGSKANSLRIEMQNLKLFHSYPDHKLVSLNDGYSVDSVVYQYLVSGVPRKNDVENWIKQHYIPANKMYMIDIRKNVVKTTEALEKFAGDLGIQGGKFPLSKTLITMVYDYFGEEYKSREE